MGGACACAPYTAHLTLHMLPYTPYPGHVAVHTSLRTPHSAWVLSAGALLCCASLNTPLAWCLLLCPCVTHTAHLASRQYVPSTTLGHYALHALSSACSFFCPHYYFCSHSPHPCVAYLDKYNHTLCTSICKRSCCPHDASVFTSWLASR